MSIAYRIDKWIEEMNAHLVKISEASVIIDEHGVILASNAPFQRLLQLEKDQVIGKKIGQFVIFPSSLLSQQDDGIRCKGRLVSHQISPVRVEMQMKAETDHGRNFYVFTFSPEYFPKTILHQALSSMPIGTVFISPEQIVLDINELACTLLDVKRAKLLYTPVDQQLKTFFSPFDHSSEQREISWQTAEGNRDLLVTANLLLDEGGQEIGVLYFLEDVTKIRLLERQILYHNRLATIGQIAAGSAHEIRNPLTSIKGFLQMFQNQLKEGSQMECDSYIDLMLNEINRISHLVGEFLWLSKPRQIDKEPLDLFQLILQLVPIIRSEAMLHDIDVIVYPADQLVPKAMTDSNLLKQVLLNLCKNAIEAMENGGELRIVMAQQDEKQLSIDICDTGPGISAHFIKQIFKPFFTTKEKGTGLGLSVCEQIMQELDGEIKVTSGQSGTTFSICLPVVPSEA